MDVLSNHSGKKYFQPEKPISGTKSVQFNAFTSSKSWIKNCLPRVILSKGGLIKVESNSTSFLRNNCKKSTTVVVLNLLYCFWSNVQAYEGTIDTFYACVGPPLLKQVAKSAAHFAVLIMPEAFLQQVAAYFLQVS